MKLDLNVAWEILNDACFEGELTRPRIFAYNTLIESVPLKNERSFLMGAYQHGHDLDRNEILVWKKQGEKDQLETLYHEMVHQYIHEVLDDHSNGHGHLFKEIYYEGLERLNDFNRLNSKSSKGSNNPLSSRRAVLWGYVLGTTTGAQDQCLSTVQTRY